MFTAVALVAGFAMADIASSTVGYTQADFVQKFNAVTPVFVDVGNDAGYNICAVDGTFTVGDNIQIFDQDGNVEATLTWKTRKGNTGWHNDKVYVPDQEIPAGQAFWVYCSAAGATMTIPAVL